MNSPAFTIKVFGVYAILTGLTLIIAPNVLLSLVGFPKAHEVWVRVLGVLAVVLGYYYWAAGAANLRPFFLASVYGRSLFCAGCLGLILLGFASWPLIIFGIVDLAAALWTYSTLRRDRSEV